MSEIDWRTRLSMRRARWEVRILDRFGRRHACGCVDMFRSRRIWCWTHYLDKSAP